MRQSEISKIPGKEPVCLQRPVLKLLILRLLVKPLSGGLRRLEHSSRRLSPQKDGKWSETQSGHSRGFKISCVSCRGRATVLFGLQ